MNRAVNKNKVVNWKKTVYSYEDVNGQKDNRTYGQTNGRTNKRTYSRMDKVARQIPDRERWQIDGQTGGRTDGITGFSVSRELSKRQLNITHW